MDSLTQATLGAAVAEAGLGKSLGRKAALWGLFLGTLPDLDILAYPLLDNVAQLSWHRGISHSLLAMLVLSPLFGWALNKIHKDALAQVPPQRASWTCFWIFFTHVLIDCFTVYGTQIFEPFSSMRVGFNNFFIIDPFYTVPILIGLIGAMVVARDSVWRFRLNTLGLVVSSVYVLWSFTAKSLMHQRFTSEFERQGIAVTRHMTHPTPFNTLLWRSLSEGEQAGESGYWIGYASLLDTNKAVEFRFVPRKAELIAPVRDTRSVQRLLWFSEGYFLARVRDGNLTFSDLRFGEFNFPDGDITTFFSWIVEPAGGETSIRQTRTQRPEGAMSKLWQQIKGN
jgi:inner membrane protein